MLLSLVEVLEDGTGPTVGCKGSSFLLGEPLPTIGWFHGWLCLDADVYVSPTNATAEEAMAVPELMNSQACFTDLQAQLVGYANRVEELASADQVLSELHAVTTRHLPLSVLGAARVPIKSGDWESVQVGKSAFLHKSVPEGWWEEYSALARGKFEPMLFLAATSIAIHTWTEVRRMFEPIGVDKWSYDLAFKHGMRDGLTCPVGGRWVVSFWSR
jgi:hypothetical protein